jgi:hypothetical protein
MPSIADKVLSQSKKIRSKLVQRSSSIGELVCS